MSKFLGYFVLRKESMVSGDGNDGGAAVLNDGDATSLNGDAAVLDDGDTGALNGDVAVLNDGDVAAALNGNGNLGDLGAGDNKLCPGPTTPPSPPGPTY
eukprot:9990214-Ditylum_brightwellii.AAC.1